MSALQLELDQLPLLPFQLPTNYSTSCPWLHRLSVLADDLKGVLPQRVGLFGCPGEFHGTRSPWEGNHGLWLAGNDR